MDPIPKRGPIALMTICVVILFLAAFQTAAAQKAMYRTPPQALIDIVDAPPTPLVSIGPNRQWLLLMHRPSLPSIAELAQPELRLAGLRINPKTNGPSRSSYYTKLILLRIEDGHERAIAGLPDAARIADVEWSPDGTHIAFTITGDNGVRLYVADIESGHARMLLDYRLNNVSGNPFSWLSDNRTLLCRVLPEGRGPAPETPEVPTGPIVQQNLGKEAPARTYQDLLKNPHDEALFEHYMTAQCLLVSLDGKTKKLGHPGIIRDVSSSPDRRYILAQIIHRPYSYIVPLYRFPMRIEVWDMDGNVVREVADLPLAEEIPIVFDAVRPGPRSVGWRSDVPATLYWTEAQDGGDPRVESEVRDKVLTLPAPFNGDSIALASLGLRFGGVTWGDTDLALVSERWRKTRQTRTWIVKPGAPAETPRLLFDRSSEDRYSDPGRPMTRRTPAGRSVLLTADGGSTLFFAGDGASPEGDRPFLDRRVLPQAGESQATRLWRSEAPYFERPVDFIDEDRRFVLTQRESLTEPANYFVRDLETGTFRQLTHFPHPTPQLANVQKELIRYDRADGVQLTATLYLPPDYAPSDGPLPLLMWAYPREYKSADAAGQVRTSPYRFVGIRPSGPLPWLALGYAILDGPAMPIIGEGDEEPNDTYIEQLVSNAQAAVDEVVRRGVADPARIAIAGHSYGAFMTANLLAHCDLFAAGIARSGAYNRSLTPFGFQAEPRSFWEAPEIYFAMSPFMHAADIDEPILLIHGQADNNSGTFPLQSKRMYAALKGAGATVRLVMLPHESHGYRARESVLHMLWEMTEWLDLYVKKARQQETIVSGSR